jgi:hypothetical protein
MILILSWAPSAHRVVLDIQSFITSENRRSRSIWHPCHNTKPQSESRMRVFHSCQWKAFLLLSLSQTRSKGLTQGWIGWSKKLPAYFYLESRLRTCAAPSSFLCRPSCRCVKKTRTFYRRNNCFYVLHSSSSHRCYTLSILTDLLLSKVFPPLPNFYFSRWFCNIILMHPFWHSILGYWRVYRKSLDLGMVKIFMKRWFVSHRMPQYEC